MRDVRSSRDLMIPSALLNNPLNSSLDFSNSQLPGPGPSPPLLASINCEVTGKGDPNTGSDELEYGGGGEPEVALPLGETWIEVGEDFRARTLAGGLGRGVVRVSSDSISSFVVCLVVVVRFGLVSLSWV